MILSESEIEKYRQYIEEVRTELLEDDIKRINIEPLSQSNINLITK